LRAGGAPSQDGKVEHGYPPRRPSRLELRFAGASDDETAAVRCPHRIEPERRTRCELRYRNTVPRAILVRLSPHGELDADVPDLARLER
jgi:hypothetical protein